MWVRTEDPENNLVKIVTTDDLYEETINVLKKIRSDVEYDFVETDNENNLPRESAQSDEFGWTTRSHRVWQTR